MPERTDPWHVQHTVESVSGTTGYQVNGPANFLIFGDEVDDLIKLLMGVKVDDAIRRLSEMDVSEGAPVQGVIPGTGQLDPMPDPYRMPPSVPDPEHHRNPNIQPTPPHTRYIEE